MSVELDNPVSPAGGSLYLLEHAGARFVSGLFWQVLSRPREADKEAKELGESMSFDYLIVRNAGSVIQAGFCSKTDGGVDGMASLAAVIARAVEASDDADPPLNWIAALGLPGGDYAYVAVQDGAFLPDGDIAGSKDEIIARMTSDYGLGEWDLVIAPDEFGFPGSVERAFDSFIDIDKKGNFKAVPSVLTKPVKASIPVKKIAIVAGVLLVVGVLAQAAMSYLDNKAMAERENALRMEEARLAEEQRLKAQTTPPWAQVPDSLDVIEKCEKAIFAIPFNPAGWEVQGFRCGSEGTLVALFGRITGSGTTFDFKREIGDRGQTRIDWNGEKASLIESLTFSMGGRESLWFAEEAVFELVGRFQQMDAKITIADAAAGASQLPTARSDAVVKHKLLNFSVSSNIKPSMYKSAYALPGVRVKAIKVTPTGEWTTEGEIYVEASK